MMTSRRFPVLPPLAAAVTVVMGACGVFVRVIRRSKSGRRHGEPTSVEQTLQCKCGKVQATVALPEKERGRVRSAHCHCNDCAAFVEWVSGQAVRAGVPPCDMMDATGATACCNIFKDCLRLDKGGEHIRFVKLRGDARMKRYYANCCFTPLGFTADASWYPCHGIYNKIMTDQAFLGPTTSRLNISSCKSRDFLPVEKKDKEEWSEGVSASFMAFVLRRVIAGVLFDRCTPDDLMDLPQASTPEILASAS